MKFRWEKKYLYWGVTALLVVIGGLLAYYLIFHGGNFKDHLQNVLCPVFGVRIFQSCNSADHWKHPKYCRSVPQLCKKRQ